MTPSPNGLTFVLAVAAAVTAGVLIFAAAVTVEAIMRNVRARRGRCTIVDVNGRWSR